MYKMMTIKIHLLVLVLVLLFGNSLEAEMEKHCVEGTGCAASGSECKGKLSGTSHIGSCEIEIEKETEICVCNFGGKYKDKRKIKCNTNASLDSLPTQATFDYVSGWDIIRDSDDSLLAEITDASGSFVVQLDTTQSPDSVKITLLEQDVTAPSFTVNGQPTGTNYLSLLPYTDFLSEGMINRNTGNGYLHVGTKVVNDIYTADNPLIFIGTARIHFDSTTGDVEIIGGSSSLPEIAPIPTLTEWVLIVLALSVAGFFVWQLKRRKAAVSVQ